MQLENVRPDDYAEMLDVWENSVRATHDFITEDDIAFFKPMIIEQAFPAVTLRCVKNEAGSIVDLCETMQLENLTSLCKNNAVSMGDDMP